MFCPNCGTESTEEQRFCKSCGLNLQLVSDALTEGSDTLGQLRLDYDGLKRSLSEIGDSLKTGFKDSGSRHHHSRKRRDTAPVEDRAEEKNPKARPRVKDWISYSWQHNLRNGLISIFAGSAAGAVWYYLAQTAILSGAIRSAEQAAGISGLEPIVAHVWLLALIPVVKGLAQVIYAAFFAESISTLNERFLPYHQSQRIESPPPVVPELANVPPSVTEQTTRTLEMTGGEPRREGAG